MTGYARSPKLIKGGIVLIDAKSGSIKRVISLQYNPEKLSRTLEVQGSGEGADSSDALRLNGPAVETLSVEVEIDATDQLDVAGMDAPEAELGIQPQLAVLESLVNPTSDQLLDRNAMANSGTLEIEPMESPLPLFIWGKSRVVPVRVTSFSIAEEFFDPQLNPIRATVTIGLRVLSIDDLGFEHKGGSLFMGYLQTKEKLATKARPGDLDMLGIGGIP